MKMRHEPSAMTPGKGDAPRPRFIPEVEYDWRWRLAFESPTCPKCGDSLRIIHGLENSRWLVCMNKECGFERRLV